MDVQIIELYIPTDDHNPSWVSHIAIALAPADASSPGSKGSHRQDVQAPRQED